LSLALNCFYLPVCCKLIASLRDGQTNKANEADERKLGDLP